MEESKNMGSAILYGIITIFLFAIVSSLIFSLILRFTATEEASLQFIITTVSFIGLFAGGFIAGGKGKQKGWLIGGLTGLAYSLVIFLFQFLGHDSLFNMEQMVYHVCYMLIAMMGGILGVNMTSNSQRNA
ncbi:TIGR04086 family membrane protein [Cytobacillus spongiae]|jgi:putative membrane protein (TIGR04086 family)|uniref:TIGR04086 family membrane protein n=1 Tax=Cytobacillus spongiae TaxID=2901381 RepID=UPI001F1799AE|nr:TIGR04086 family membrane protein [Cytobacillus spongiae]UII55011.1 TIGR04086 family membrane protein [Cytobacillus spongiae]